MSNKKKNLIERLNVGPILCAEGYLFAMERRGYLQAGPFVPEVVLEHPEVLAEVHRDFIRAGSDVVQAFTYYGHREKLRIIGKENLLEQEAIKFKNFIQKSVEGKIFGPVSAPIFKIKKNFRVRLLIRGKKSLKVQNSLAKIISKYKFPSGIKLTVDVDPINFN